MNIKITGKELKATESIKDYIARKSERLIKYFGEEFDVSATIKTEGNEQVAEIAVVCGKDNFRANSSNKDLYASIDKVIDILEGQIRKAKTKKDKQNMTDSIRLTASNSTTSNIRNQVIKIISYDIKPMHVEDAKLKLLENAQNKFLAFVNIDSGKVNIIYKLKDGKNFGLVEPEA